jgi:hypothetical protein
LSKPRARQVVDRRHPERSEGPAFRFAARNAQKQQQVPHRLRRFGMTVWARD